MSSDMRAQSNANSVIFVFKFNIQRDSIVVRLLPRVFTVNIKCRVFKIWYFACLCLQIFSWTYLFYLWLWIPNFELHKRLHKLRSVEHFFYLTTHPCNFNSIYLWGRGTVSAETWFLHTFLIFIWRFSY